MSINKRKGKATTMSINKLQQKAIEYAHSTAPDATERYNRVLDQLEQKMPPRAFYDFAARIFGEDNC